VKIYERPLRFFDVETTHSQYEYGEIIEAAIINERGAVCFNKKILPEHIETASEEALDINGYDEAVWSLEAISWAEASEKIIKELKGCLIVGIRPHFDVGFLRMKADLNAEDFPYYNLIDVAALIWEHLCPPCDRNSLSRACAVLGVTNRGAHTALMDVIRTREVYNKLIRATWFHRLWWKIAGYWRLRSPGI